MIRIKLFLHQNQIILIMNFSKTIKFLFTQIIKTQSQIVSKQSEFLRLSKWMSMKSVCSRREAEQIIKLGLVRVDGKRVYENMLVPYCAQMKAFTQTGLKQQRPITKLWMINKPRQYICTKRDPQKRKTIYQLLPDYQKVYGHLMSVGRLDYNSEGLLLMTNDSILKQYLQSPLNQFPRRYQVKVHGRVTAQKMQKMNSPIIINGIQYGPLRARFIRQLSTNVWLDVQLKTGKNRQIRKIMQKCDLQVNKLIRKQFGPFKLNKLLHGQVQQLQIPQFLQRKLKKQKAKILSGKQNLLIEIDIRNKALQHAKNQKQQTNKIQDNTNKDQDDDDRLLE